MIESADGQWSETYVYEGERLSTIQSNDIGERVFLYDDAGRLLSYGDPAAPLTLSYAENGRIDAVASSQLVATFEFGDDGLLSTLRTTFTGDPLGGVVRTYTWEDCRLTTRVDAYETGVTEMATYSYDAQGNLISIVMPDEEEHYDYGCW